MAKNFLLLILLFNLSKASTEFIFSYKLCTQNSQVTNEQFYISKAMVLSNKATQKVCILPKKDATLTTLKYLKQHKYKLLECFKKSSILLNSNSTNFLHDSYSQITIRTIPIRFTVKFNNGFGIIGTFK